MPRVGQNNYLTVSLKFHFLREQHNPSGFKDTSFYLRQVAQCFQGPEILNIEGLGVFSAGAEEVIIVRSWMGDAKTKGGHSSLG